MSGGSFTIFVERSVSLLFLIPGLGVLLSRVGGHIRSRRKVRDQEMGDL
jgi:TctA family transporter